MSFYPVSSQPAIPGVEIPGGDQAAVMVAVPVSALAWPVRPGSGGDGRSALLVTGPAPVRAGDLVAWCKVVVVASALLRRDGRVQAQGRPCDHARLGVAEQELDRRCGPGIIEQIAAGVCPTGKIKAVARREMSVAATIRAVLLMTLMPDADHREVLTTLLGELAEVPWRRAHAVPSGTVLSTWRAAIGPAPLQQLQRELLGAVVAEHRAEGGFRCFYPETILARAWVVACEGSIREAIAAAHEAADTAASSGQWAHEVLALHTAVCFGDRTVADRLAELATQVDGPRAPAAAAHAAALATDNGDALLAASSQLQQMGALLLAADAAAQAAAAHNRNGRRGSAHLAAARAHRLAELCEGARTPALRAMAQPLPLTVREREIVTLAAAGHSNREIAARLVLSIRTVEGHLYRACAKLGTSDRASLSTILHGE